MRFGFCGTTDMAEKAVQAGFDYIEPRADSIYEMTDAEYADAVCRVKSAGIKCEAFNVLFPNEIKLTGPDADLQKAERYIQNILPKLRGLGSEIIVLGNQGVRTYPQGFRHDRAYEQFIQVARMLGSQSYNNGVTAVLEPLERGATNLINTMAEGIQCVKDTAHPCFLLLADFFHCSAVGDGGKEVQSGGIYLRHTHIACPGTRKNPTEGDGGGYEEFFAALANIGYNERMTFEGKWDFDKDAGETLRYMRELSKGVVIA
ncbi:MAG: sugar phosphate isomerase/epimerase [Oscillospiraceae bacterium]|nr:sugar phosphate isomerase/epimerase [Oscillospiraceae bacterium]